MRYLKIVWGHLVIKFFFFHLPVWSIIINSFMIIIFLLFILSLGNMRYNENMTKYRKENILNLFVKRYFLSEITVKSSNVKNISHRNKRYQISLYKEEGASRLKLNIFYLNSGLLIL